MYSLKDDKLQRRLITSSRIICIIKIGSFSFDLNKLYTTKTATIESKIQLWGSYQPHKIAESIAKHSYTGG
jgi:hypothetical protein